MIQNASKLLRSIIEFQTSDLTTDNQSDVTEWLYVILRGMVQFKLRTFAEFFVETTCNTCGVKLSKQLSLLNNIIYSFS